ncbi:hypothetical protein DPMN_142573 [Dreissena polymorpha]|uniref:Uncharacterized protein n=1 Tax=Dreissena polymorpha TaxID=45954 RepID=A0A9D4JNK9_DREPO|nr:hypothetical protein DPMN_142573 [Dreissena polymorpha]
MLQCLPYHLEVQVEKFPFSIGCRIAKDVTLPSPMSLEDVFYNRLLLYSSP